VSSTTICVSLSARKSIRPEAEVTKFNTFNDLEAPSVAVTLDPAGQR